MAKVQKKLFYSHYPKGWQYKVYEANLIDPTTLELTLVSPDGDENFPGNVTAKVTYKLTEDNAIDIKYSATRRPAWACAAWRGRYCA